MMTLYEYIYGIFVYFLPMYPVVRKMIRKSALNMKTSGKIPGKPVLLDVGGRRSGYTCGIEANVYISELEEHGNDMGINRENRERIKRKRSNIAGYYLDDMSESKLPENSFDMVTTIEVIEHVQRDEDFIRNIHRVLKPGGILILTTPNGDFVPNTNPEHVRHYKFNELKERIGKYFPNTEYQFISRDFRWRCCGLVTWSLLHPVRTIQGMICGLIGNLFYKTGEISNAHHILVKAYKNK